MKATTLITLVASFAFPIAASASFAATRENPIISQQTALRTATNELHRQEFVLPVGYETEVAKSLYEPEVGSATPLFSVTFFAGRVGHRIQLYLVTIDRRNGEVDFVSDSLTTVEATLPSSSLSAVVLRTAASELRRRRLPLPEGYRTHVAKSIVFSKRGPDKKVWFVTFVNSRAKHAKRLYQIAINRRTGDIEFVFDFPAGTMN